VELTPIKTGPLSLSAGEQPPAGRRILVVDDDPGIRESLVLLLEDEGYEVRAAPNGRAALELLARWRPAVILLDLMMPVMDGWTFRAHQLAHRAWGNIPVVVMSAGRNLTADTYALVPAATLAKPFNLDVVVDTVRAVAR
jgi:CheY-like chemotaxis protein